MAQQTAVEWLAEQLQAPCRGIPSHIIEQAKRMEEKQIIKTAIQCHFEGTRQGNKTSLEYIQYGEQYYNEIYGN